MFEVLTSLRLTWSVGAGDAAGSSSSSSWVGCLEQIMVSSVIQLKVKQQDSRLKIQQYYYYDQGCIHTHHVCP